MSIEAIIKDDAECLALYREAMKEQPGTRNDLCNNVTEVESQKTGNSKAYTCERLKKDAPELFEEVKAGRMSAQTTHRKAGF